ncbi:MAG: 6,7-dimethyl-8-ribityllumazine synthase [Gemmatimonadota bacterium]|nr:6,7-dimethyl-8-ribityllumazine synthase [Gemmatimonadota bacterium]MDH3367258.1 6,7-dimethyl-8-ribityllumazine synthase [Gemmatimonadota bacterium]MDH3479013.1 6,7-dimethyl-8-ribityllumazine synthase [Gemmatimonadota bacterium]MDH3571134.1 6,7-dimethyl-8-ribityllumazine synthase [Gemmatimonadota bacterium]
MPAKVPFDPRPANPADAWALVVVSRFNEGVTRRLLDGARAALREEGFADGRVDVVWVPGAFELPVALHRGIETGRYAIGVALGAVIRGETPHFDYVSDTASHGIMAVSTRFGVPVGFGLLTCDTLGQALARAGGEAGNKGEEAAHAAVETLRALAAFRPGAAT